MATFVIVGASLAGVRAAAGLRAGGFDGHVVLVTDEPHLPYDRPPLSKGLLMGTSSAAEILLEKEDFYVENAIELRLGAKVARLLPSERRVVLPTDGSSEPTRSCCAPAATLAASVSPDATFRESTTSARWTMPSRSAIASPAAALSSSWAPGSSGRRSLRRPGGSGCPWRSSR